MIFYEFFYLSKQGIRHSCLSMRYLLFNLRLRPPPIATVAVAETGVVRTLRVEGAAIAGPLKMADSSRSVDVVDNLGFLPSGALPLAALGSAAVFVCRGWNGVHEDQLLPHTLLVSPCSIFSFLAVFCHRGKHSLGDRCGQCNPRAYSCAVHTESMRQWNSKRGSAAAHFDIPPTNISHHDLL